MDTGKLNIGTINGSYDLFHDGHKFSIQQALNKVDNLILLLNSDKSINLYKGKSRPIQNYQQRKKMILNHFPQIKVIKLNQLSPINLLESIKPDIHFVSDDWGKNPVEKNIIESYGGKIIFIKKLEGLSTTSVIKSKNINLKKSDKAIFFDRDGTINIDTGYVSKLEEVKYFKNTFKGMELLSSLNFKNIIITNQSGVARGYFSKKQLSKINNKIKSDIENHNGRVDYIYSDTSHPDEKSLTRKPNNGLLIKAAIKFNLALKDCWMIGDKYSDVYAGRSSNCKAILIENSRAGKVIKGVKPDFVVKDLIEAYNLISTVS